MQPSTISLQLARTIELPRHKDQEEYSKAALPAVKKHNAHPSEAQCSVDHLHKTAVAHSHLDQVTDRHHRATVSVVNIDLHARENRHQWQPSLAHRSMANIRRHLNEVSSLGAIEAVTYLIGPCSCTGHSLTKPSFCAVLTSNWQADSVNHKDHSYSLAGNLKDSRQIFPPAVFIFEMMFRPILPWSLSGSGRG